MTTAFTIGARVDLEVLDFPGRWSVWSQAADSPGAFFMVPADDDARALGLKYAVVRAISSAAAVKPVLSLVRTDPPRNDLVEADRERRTRQKERA